VLLKINQLNEGNIIMPQTANNVPFQQPYGYAISWGLGSTTYTVGPATVLPQSADNELGYDFAQIRDGRGTTVAVVSYDPHDTMTLEFVVIQGTSSFDSITASLSYPTQGTMISLTGPDSSDPVIGTNWIVQTNTVRRSNTDATKIQLKAVRYGGVQQ
jgi:hypothetical protein